MLSVGWWIFIGAMAVLLLLIGAAAFFVHVVEKKMGEPVGDLVVDPSETMPGEGMYVIFYTQDPKAFTDGQSVTLKVRVRK